MSTTSKWTDQEWKEKVDFIEAAYKAFWEKHGLTPTKKKKKANSKEGSCI